ncbi:MAG: NUDIX domain-containing protein [Patescibacteria group bacterium]|jgi:isopentenyldiphosphate isomerase
MTEYLDIVNEADEVIGRAPRDQIYAEKKLHRIVHVLLFTSSGKIILQKRAKHVSFCPLHWSTSVGGHVRSGETWEQAAVREAQEELGIQIEPLFGYTDMYTPVTAIHKILTTFTAVYDGVLTPNPKEVDSIRAFSLKEAKTLIHNGEKIHPELAFILTTHYL